MNDIKQLFFHLTPTTLAAIVADLDGDTAMIRQRQAAAQQGYDNDDNFFDLVVEARAERDGMTEGYGERKFTDTVADILARQS